MGRLALALGALSFGLATGVAAAASGTTTTTGPDTTITTTLSTTVTEPPTTATVTTTRTGPERTVTAPEPKTTTSVVATTPATKTSSGSSVPAWAWVVIGLGAVGIATSIYLVGRDRGRRTEATRPDRPAGGAPYDPDPPAR